MSIFRSFSVLGVLLAGLLAAVPAAAAPGDLDWSRTVDGMRVHLGVISAREMRRHPDRYTEHFAAGGPPSGPHMYHVLVTLLERASGVRITDAEVEMRVSPLGLAGPEKRLEPMAAGGLVCYCNYFYMPPSDRYEISVRIRRPPGSHVARARFLYTPHRGP
jgi:hypothetical protein